jgi:GR25 family glycosyltransferase involved in LPS biosynthesis
MNKLIENIYVINMDKDTDRLNNIYKECNKNNIKFERFTGIDAGELSIKDKNKYVTKFCQKFCTNSMIGCGTSHIKIYEDVIKKKYKNVLILEDDVYFIKNFHKKLNEALEELPKDYDILYIGAVGLSNKKTSFDFNLIFKLISNKNNNNKQDTNYKNIFCPIFPLGTHGYIISNQGCKKILNIFNKVNYHIDFQINYNNKNLNIYATNKKLVHQDWKDSNNSDMLSFPKYPNILLNKFYDCNNVPYSWIFNISLIKICNISIKLWHILFFIFGIINYKYLNIIIFIYFIIDFDFNSFIIFLLGKKLSTLYFKK